MNLFPRGTATYGPPGDETSVYRYTLTRLLDTLTRPPGPIYVSLGVNPSTATADEDDATIRRDLGYARALQCSALVKANLFAYRNKDVRVLRTVADPVGPDNDRHLLAVCQQPNAIVVCGWGPPSKVPRELRARFEEVPAMLRAAGVPLHVLRFTSGGYPEHPLRLPAILRPVLWLPTAPAPADSPPGSRPER